MPGYQAARLVGMRRPTRAAAERSPRLSAPRRPRRQGAARPEADDGWYAGIVAAPDVDVVAYARLSVALAQPDADREAILADHGLDEDGWQRIDDAWTERLAQADEAHGDRDGVPPLVLAHANAFAAAQRERAGALLTFDRYVEITRALQRGRDIAAVLERFSIDLATYLNTHQHFTLALATDPELAAAFRRGMR